MYSGKVYDKLKRELQGPQGLIQEVRKSYIPTGENLAKFAWERASFHEAELTARRVKNNFNAYLCELIDLEYKIYLEYEELCLNKGVVEQALKPQIKDKFPATHSMVKQTVNILHEPSDDDITKLTKIISNIRSFTKLIEQSFSQGRMARAGGSSQFHLKKLFSIAGYNNEFETQQILNGTVDFLFPNKYLWERDKRRCVVVSIKRTLRERYKQVFEELGLTGGITIYLLVTETFEESIKDITISKVDRLNKQNIYLVVRDEIKNTRFQDADNVISFTAFIKDELPSKRELWSPLLRKYSK